MLGAALKFFAGLIVIIVLGVLAIHANALPGSRQDAAFRLDALIADIELRHDWVTINRTGQRLELIGTAPDDNELETLLETFSLTNAVDGPFTSVDSSQLTITPVPEPHIWVAEHEGGVLALSGAVPSQRTRDAIYQLAAMRFTQSEIAGELTIVPTSLNEDEWESAASIALQGLARLNAGGAQIADGKLTLSGEAEDSATENAIRTLLGALPTSLTSEVDLRLALPEPRTVTEPAPDETLSVVADVDLPQDNQEVPVATGNGGSSDQPTADDEGIICLDDVLDFATSISIGYETSEVDINARSREQLDEFAKRLGRCPDIRVTITGHTDSRGSAASNQQLSLYRADAVAAYLTAQGVDRSRFVTAGAGESEPIATNLNTAGRSQNRRIEFAINDGS